MKALVLSGGSAKGAFQVGALEYILGTLKTDYEILCGVSIGAINAAFIAQFPKGDEEYAAKQLSKLWSTISNKDIYKRWFPFGALHTLWKSSIYDSSPLINLVKSVISLESIRKSGKQVFVGAVNLSSGKYHVIDQNDDAFIDFVIASASFPGMFSPINIRDHLWVDAGIKQISPIKTAIDAGGVDIDVIITLPEIRIKKFLANPSAVDTLIRSFDLSTDKIMSNDIEKALMHNSLVSAGLSDKKLVNLNVIKPKNNLTDDLLDFNCDKIKYMMSIGYDTMVNKKI